MGWISGNKLAPASTSVVEKIEIRPDRPVRSAQPQDILERKYAIVPAHLSDNNLPFIPKETVVGKQQPGLLAEGDLTSDPRRHDWWIVIDNVVYDCTDFVLEHPGGQQVIMSFVGQDCSWQFWRFHRDSQIQRYGKQLRIGRTEGVANRFKEPKRFVGLSKLSDDSW
ncbi:uncharacterized protein HMPREF1541_08439 [Cyphellophora europaea CBS 101466]|uniref:Cytochrome b5 heme-binding domain-containing protein n=1 Tax=Cyphellophora europaea (strain CBS 101466) TaxID=1220924 RepID=W2RP43_CYPE1|nr:uncharacterized protein HMPREF1541_08439 [Cyphellophora europaea CBS 101466]ETN37448.1 hypothetical protein HMPREF1541_08439 [Cyphellophora europaea CBS 101466]